VAWYRLSLAYRALGNTEEQQKAMAKFQELRAGQPSRQPASARLFSPSEVTPQEVDMNADQK
jgi:hypothetical protein